MNDPKISPDGHRAAHPVAFQLMRTPAGKPAWSQGVETEWEHVGVVETVADVEAFLAGADPKTLPTFQE